MAGVEYIKYAPGKTAKVRITSPTRVQGRHLAEGVVAEVSEQDAHLLISARKATKYVEPVKAESTK